MTRAELIDYCRPLTFVELTREILEAARPARGWKKFQLALLGVSWPPRKDWTREALGKLYPGSDIAALLELRDADPVRLKETGKRLY